MATEIKKYVCDKCGAIYDERADADECENNHARVYSYEVHYMKGNMEEKAYPPHVDIQFHGNLNGLSPRKIRYVKTEGELLSNLCC